MVIIERYDDPITIAQKLIHEPGDKETKSPEEIREIAQYLTAWANRRDPQILTYHGWDGTKITPTTT